MRSAAAHSARVYDRSYVLAIFTVAYVAIAAMAQQGSRPVAVGVLLAAPFLLGWAWRRTRHAEGLSAHIHPSALGALRFCVWGAVLWLAARTGPAGRPAFDLAANVGLMIAVVAAQVALARVPGSDGLVQPPRSARALDAAGFCALVWGVACALPAARTFWPQPSASFDPLATDYATSAASIASLLVLLGAALRMRLTRRLELGVLDRAAGAVALCATAFSVALPAALVNLAAPDRALPLGALAASLACAWAATTPEATAVATSLRGALVVMVFGAPLALGAAALAQHVAGYAGVITLAGSLATLLVGIAARAAARPLTLEQTRWLEALQAAARAAREADPDVAITATLSALQGVESTIRARPELWRSEPPEVLSVDVAGYLHTARAEVPSGIFELARSEPERMLRRDVLAALEVRRPDARPLLGWMDARDALYVTLVTDEQQALGLLSFPKGSRKSPVTLEEAIAARQLCDRLSAVLSLSSSIARSRQREATARERADELVVETAKLEAIIELQSRPRDYALDMLAAEAQVACYSARARAAIDALGRHAGAGHDVLLELPVGIDALGYAALVHTAGARRSGPFVVVDGTAASAHDPASYAALDSPLARARGGTLLVSNAAALPIVAQDALAVALAERPPAEAPGAFGLIASTPRPLAELIEGHYLSRALARFLAPHAVSIPPLVERPEDLRGLIMDRLCKTGVRFDGQTLGIEPRALSLLVDYAWPGNLRELADVVERAAHAARGERVRAADLEAVRFNTVSLVGPEPRVSSPPPTTSSTSSIPVSGVRRGRRPSASAPGGETSDAPSASPTAADDERADDGRPLVRRRRRR
jgi:DNA-binding NtrC family response regulator